MTTPVKDNDRDEITVTLGDKLLRSYSYENEAERRVKMRMAREFVEGWFQGAEAPTEVLKWVETWVNNPVGAYSVQALDGLFSMTRERIAALSQASE